MALVKETPVVKTVLANPTEQPCPSMFPLLYIIKQCVTSPKSNKSYVCRFVERLQALYRQAGV